MCWEPFEELLNLVPRADDTRVPAQKTGARDDKRIHRNVSMVTEEAETLPAEHVLSAPWLPSKQPKESPWHAICTDLVGELLTAGKVDLACSADGNSAVFPNLACSLLVAVLVSCVGMLKCSEPG